MTGKNNSCNYQPVQYDILVGGANNTISNVGPGSSGQILQSGGNAANPSYSTATYPSTAGTSGNVLTSNGTNFVSSAPSGGIQTLTGNSGGAISPSAGNINLISAHSTPTLVGSGSTITLDFNLTNLALGSSLSSVTSATSNVGYGQLALNALTSGAQNVAVGTSALAACTGGTTNTALGYSAANAIVNGINNVAVGTGSLGNSGDVSYCVAIGFDSQLGTSANENTSIGWETMNASPTGGLNVAVGFSCMSGLSSGTNNVCVGNSAGASVGTQSYNTYLGSFSGQGVSAGQYNTCVGANTYANHTSASGSQNSILGTSAGYFLTSGSSNILFGYTAGFNYTSTESSNICIGNLGTTSESNVIRIGTQGTSAGQQNECFIAGITGATVTGTAVLCSSSGQLGTVASSERYKENIEDMPQEISILDLRPIQFNYKKFPEAGVQYGLLAENVHRDFPYLCVYNDENQPESVKYHELCTFLLHEVKKLNERIVLLEKT